MLRLLMNLCLLCGICSVSAQTYSGKVTDEKNRPLPYANVVLLSLPDSAFVTGTVSDESGAFTLRGEKPKLLLRVSSIGYATIYNKVEKQDLGTIQLLPDAQLLGEVVVKGDLPKVQLKGDAQVTNVTGTILEKAGTGNDLLSKLPGVSAEEGTVNVFGSGTAEIYINGRKIRNASELDQLSSDNVKRVEVVRNPGARYDATVKAVVRIYTKKAQGEGFGFNNRFAAKYQYDWTTVEQFNFNYRKGGFDLGGTLFGTDINTEDNKRLVQHTFLDKVWRQENDFHAVSHDQYATAVLSLNYQFNEKHSLGARYEFDRTPKSVYTIDPVYSRVFQDGALYEENTSRGTQRYPAASHALNVYYNGQLGDWNIDFNADGLWSYTKSLQDVKEQYVTEGAPLQEQAINTDNKNDNTLYAAKLVISRPLGGGNFSFGGEYTYTDRVTDYVNAQGVLEDVHSNIRENAVSAFAEYARSFGNLQAQAGVRYEHLASNYYEGGVRIGEQSRTYDNVFPTVSLALPVGKTQLSINYTGGIERPAYGLLRSDIHYVNRYTYEGGNPLLQPSFINRLSLDASYKWVYFNAAYTHTKDVLIQISEAYSDDNPSVSMFVPVNKFDSDKLYATLSLSPTIGIWSPRLTLMLLQQWYKVDTPDGLKNFNNPMGNFSWNNHFRLPWGIGLDVDLSAVTAGSQDNWQQTEAGWSADSSILKTFLNERLSLQLQGTDLFNSSQARAMQYNSKRTTMLDQEARRSFRLTLRYKFNATKSKYKGTGAGQEQRSRM